MALVRDHADILRLKEKDTPEGMSTVSSATRNERGLVGVQLTESDMNNGHEADGSNIGQQNHHLTVTTARVIIAPKGKYIHSSFETFHALFFPEAKG